MWRIIRKRLKRIYFRKLLLQYTLLWFLIIFTIFIIYYKFHSNNAATNNENKFDCQCEGWRNHFNSIEEEKRVFQSVRLEHIHLMEKLEEATEKLESISKIIPIREEELKHLEIKIGELKLLQKEYNDRRNVQLKLPHSPLYPKLTNEIQLSEKKNPSQKANRFLENSLDYSRCSISTFFRFFIYPPSSRSNKMADDFYKEFMSNNDYITMNPKEACIFVAILEPGNVEYKNFAHFGLEGHNHLLIDLEGKMEPELIGAAMLLSNGLNEQNYRPKMDIAAFLTIPEFDQNHWEKLPPLLPANRKYFLNFLSNSSELNEGELKDLMELKKSLDSSQDAYLIEFECSKELNNPLCYRREERRLIGRQSIFSLIIPNKSTFQQQFYESLEDGSIPVICSIHQPLPFDEVVDWRLAAIQIPYNRFPEIHFILRSISTNDLLEIKRKGRYFFENLLADRKVLVYSILALIRHRLQMPGKEEPEPSALPLYNKSIADGNWIYPSFISTSIKPPYDDEYLGPNEVPMQSPQYIHNFTAFTLYSSKLWNEYPFATKYSPRFLTNDHLLPSDAEFEKDTSFRMRPISPGSGVEFSQSLGGNRPREQFTIVMATFNRERVLMNTLERLIGLPYLNRIIVIWNDVQNAPFLAAWPRLHVPLLFVNGTRNSLNNRFIPYKEIETEAILSMDDDIDLKQYEIIFAFRVWREQRNRIVGFPARYNAHFGGENFYNSNHTCQYSMVLTGAAFIHKFYFNAYTFHMPQIIRSKVDEWMNCEDLAMNFLVAHLSRKPPLKTTSKWTLKCPTCAETLSKDIGHFNERHECIRFFIRVYGYNPLLFTQFRVDSVLFKTRVPANHQKCFRYV